MRANVARVRDMIVDAVTHDYDAHLTTSSLVASVHGVRLADFDYELPAERIAQMPIEPRDAARLLVDRGEAPPEHRHVRDLAELLRAGDLLVVNDTKVIPARLRAASRHRRRRRGAAARTARRRAAHVGGAGAPGPQAQAGRDAARRRRRRVVEIGARTAGRRHVHRRRCVGSVDSARRARRARRDAASAVHHRAPRPTPTAIRRSTPPSPASPAAPTAGLHFTPELLDAAGRDGRRDGQGRVGGRARHVPARRQPTIPLDHLMHTERYRVPAETIAALPRSAERVVAVGHHRGARPRVGGRTGRARRADRLFIHRGYDWQLVDLMMTNFHLPRTTLLMMIDAFVGDRWRRLYDVALAERLPLPVVRRRDAARPSPASADVIDCTCGERLARRASRRVRDRRVRRPGAQPASPRPPRGTYRTPCFMPVGTRGAIKYLSAADYERLGAEIVLGNTYHLMLRPGAETVAALRRPRQVRRLGRADAHRLGRVPGVLARARGRRRRRHVQEHVRRLHAPLHARDRGRHPGAARRRHPDGARRLPAAADAARGDPAGRRAHRGVGRAGARRAHRGRTKRCSGSCRAASSETLRAESAQRTVELDFDGYGIGGLWWARHAARWFPALAAALDHLPPDRPRYLMGVGDPAALVEAVALGVDQFDCVMQTRLGRHGTALTSDGQAARQERQARPERRAARRGRARARSAARTAAATSATCSRSASRPRRGWSACTTSLDAAADGPDAGGDRGTGPSTALRREVLAVWG